MTNKFKRMRPLPIPEDANYRPAISDLTLGVELRRSPRLIPPGASPSLSNVRFEEGAIRKEFGTTAVGSAAAAKVLAIGEYKYILGGASFHRLIRMRLAAGKLKLEIWDGATWVDTITSTPDVADVYLSVVSTQDRFLIADGQQILTWYETPLTEERQNQFPAGNSLTDEGDQTDATVTPAGANDNKYYIRYRAEATVVNGSGYNIEVVLLHNAVQIDSKVLTIASGSHEWVDQLFVINSALVDLDTVSLQLKEIGATNPPQYQEAWAPGTKDLEATKSIEASPDDGAYTFRFNAWHSIFGNDFEVEYYYRAAPADPWTALGTTNFYTDSLNFERTFTIGDLPAGAEFALDIISANPATIESPNTGKGIHYNAIVPGTDIIVNVKGYNQPDDEDTYHGIEYTIDVPASSVLDVLSDDAPAARFLLPFGDRVLAFRDGGDHQVAAWSSDGDISDWADGDSGSTVLVDTRSDGIDDIMGAGVLSAAAVAVFRKRSIMRAQETGNVALAMGFFHWLENLGTESPFSIQTTPAGILFLGHDLQVYMLTPGGPQPVGGPIHKQLIRDLTSNLDLVDSAFDPVFGEYYLGIPESNASRITGVWIFELATFLEEQAIKWRYRPMDVERFATVSVIE